MNRQTQDLLDRTLRFATHSIAFSDTLPRNAVGFTLTKQLIRSTSSVGANLREAHRSRSRAEFASKIQICLQEASESEYWLQLIKQSNLGDRESARSLLEEAGQLIAIFAAITRTTKARLTAK